MAPEVHAAPQPEPSAPVQVSLKRTPEAGDVVTCTVLPAGPTLPAASTARTAYEYVVAAVSPVSVKVSPVTVAGSVVPSRTTR